MDKFGISVALLTPFDTAGQIETGVLAAHAGRVLAKGAKGITLYGTTGEGASMGREERAAGLDALLVAGVPADKITLGVSACALDDAADQVALGHDHGIRSFLLLPPFYFKGCTDQGLEDWHLELFNRCNADTRFILYHIPQVTDVPLSVELVGRIAAAAPDRVQAIKDSSGNWQNTAALLEANTVPVLVGDERQVHKAAARGASGSICGFANLYPERMVRVLDTATEDKTLSEQVTCVVGHPVIPALKVLMAAQSGSTDWERVRYPLTTLDAAAREQVLMSMQDVA